MATYPYTYLAAFMNPDFQRVVVAEALKHAAKSGGAARQRLERAARSAGISAPGFRPGKMPVQQLAKPLVTPVSRSSQVTPFTGNEEIAAPIFVLWVDAKADLRSSVSAFLAQKGLPFSETLPAEGFADSMSVDEMDALTREMGIDQEADSAAYDDTALMLVCLLGRAPVYESEGGAAEAENAPAEPSQPDGEDAAQATAA
jgi:hypothetical protein